MRFILVASAGLLILGLVLGGIDTEDVLKSSEQLASGVASKADAFLAKKVLENMPPNCSGSVSEGGGGVTVFVSCHKNNRFKNETVVIRNGKIIERR